MPTERDIVDIDYRSDRGEGEVFLFFVIIGLPVIFFLLLFAALV